MKNWNQNMIRKTTGNVFFIRKDPAKASANLACILMRIANVNTNQFSSWPDCIENAFNEHKAKFLSRVKAF